MHKKISILILCLMIMLCGCTTTKDKLKIDVIVKSTTSQFFKSVYSGANAASKEYNIDLSFVGPENEEDYKSQVKMIENSISKNVDAIVLSSIDYHKLTEPVEKAVSKGIKVVIIDSDVNSDKVSLRITTNNFEAGKMAGQAALDIDEPSKTVGIVNFDANTANGQERENGFREALKENKDIKNIYTINVQSNIASATKGTFQLLEEHPDINVIATFNEWTTLGVGDAMREKKLKNKVSVIAFDNNPISVEMLETGEIDALIVQNPFALGYLGVEEAYELVNGKKESEEFVYTKTVTITKNNMFEQENQKIVFPFD
ncbi:MAG: substrate-binding domain-containing protein [Coprobacillus sp.]